MHVLFCLQIQWAPAVDMGIPDRQYRPAKNDFVFTELVLGYADSHNSRIWQLWRPQYIGAHYLHRVYGLWLRFLRICHRLSDGCHHGLDFLWTERQEVSPSLRWILEAVRDARWAAEEHIKLPVPQLPRTILSCWRRCHGWRPDSPSEGRSRPGSIR